MNLFPAFLVDRLPVDWWRPGNSHRLGPVEVHFCDDDHVRMIEVNGTIVGQGRALFPCGRWEA